MPKLADIIEFKDPTGDVIAVRAGAGDEDVINWGSQLVVQNDQVAVFYRDGKPMVVFQPGRHMLTTQNAAFVTKFFMGFMYGRGNTPFRATVYYVSMKLFPNMGWGTPQPVPFFDNVVGNLNLRVHGNYTFQVKEPTVFMNKIVGTRPIFRKEDIGEHCRDQYIIPAVTDTLVTVASSLADQESQRQRQRGELMRLTVHMLPTKIREIGIGVKSLLQDEFRSNGLELTDFGIKSISPTPEDQKKLDEYSARLAADAAKAAGAARLDMSGGAAAYQQFQMGDAMVAMSNRPGGGGAGGGNPMDTGVNLGLAMMMPQMMSNMMGGMQKGVQAAEAPKVDPVAKLKQLKELLDAGILSQEEYDAKKAEMMKLL